MVGIVLFITLRIFPEIEISKVEQKGEQIQIIGNLDTKDYTRTITSRRSNETRESTKDDKEETQDEDTSKSEENSKQKTTDSETNKKDTTEKYVSISDVKISKTMDLTIRTGLSKKDFIKLIAEVTYDTSGFFEKNAEYIYDLCEKYSINEIFFCGLISAESGWNIASNHRSTHNYISLMKNGKLIQYSSEEEGLKVAAQKLHTNYLSTNGCYYNGKTLAGVKVKFCPNSSTWVNLVYSRMQQILY